MRRLPLRSPPRMRGKDPPAAAMQGCPGITPACAGKSMVRRSDSRRSQGSPPRMRGKAWCADLTAGAPRDHPRVCGEKFPRLRDRSHPGGSPPRMRGKAERHDFKRPRKGITPAYAGKRQAGKGVQAVHRDHPRVCGEKDLENPEQAPMEGSPPRMRGKDVFSSMWRRYRGITPAYAGKSR